MCPEVVLAFGFQSTVASAAGTENCSFPCEAFSFRICRTIFRQKIYSRIHCFDVIVARLRDVANDDRRQQRCAIETDISTKSATSWRFSTLMSILVLRS